MRSLIILFERINSKHEKSIVSCLNMILVENKPVIDPIGVEIILKK